MTNPLPFELKNKFAQLDLKRVHAQVAQAQKSVGDAKQKEALAWLATVPDELLTAISKVAQTATDHQFMEFLKTGTLTAPVKLSPAELQALQGGWGVKGGTRDSLSGGTRGTGDGRSARAGEVYWVSIADQVSNCWSVL